MEASNNSNPGAWPQTRCANCQTVFEVPAELLESNDTRVRCGECLSIFDALEGVQQQSAINQDALSQGNNTSVLISHGDEPQSQPAEGLEEFSNLDVTYSDFDLFSEEAELPEVRYLEEVRDKEEFNFDSVEIDHDQTFSETLFVNDVTINADLPIGNAGQNSGSDTNGDDAREIVKKAVIAESRRGETENQAELGMLAKVDFSLPPAANSGEPIVFQYHDPDDTGGVDAGDVETKREPAEMFSPPAARQRQHRLSILQGTVGTLVLMLLLGTLYLYREREQLYNDPRVRPAYTAFCAVTGCTVPLPFDPDQLGLLRRSIYAHPQVAGALVINVVIKNKAAFSQRYPVLVIRLEETNGAALATRDFLPRDYLEPKVWRKQAMIEAGAAISITLEIKDPGENAGSFTLNFR